MPKKILAFAASNSKQSINKKLVKYVSSRLTEYEVDLVDLNDYEMPIYSIDREKESGIPQLALDFKQNIKDSDGIIISFAEHNGAYTAAYKNIYDWISRIEKSVWNDKPMMLMATSPGGRGAVGVLELAFNAYSRGNSNIVGKFSLPEFFQNFDDENGIMNDELKSEITSLLNSFRQKVN